MNTRTLIALIAAATAAGAGGYLIGRDRSAPPATPPALAANKPAVGGGAVAQRPLAPLRTGDAVPAGHASALPPQSGKAHISTEVDPGAKFTHFRVGNRNVKGILPDGEFMWVGTSGGVIRYNTHTDEYRLFDLRSGLLANGIFHVGKLDDRIVVGTYGGGMALFDAARETWKVYNIPQGLADAFVYDVLKTANGDVWIATWSGANQIHGGALDDRSKWSLYTVENTGGGLPNDWVYALATDQSGTVWFATEGGLARYKDGNWTRWRHEDGLGADYEIVRNQIQFKNDPAQFSSHHAQQKTEMGLQGVDVAYNPNYIVALLVDRDGTVWCGTWGGGLARFDGSTWKNYTVADGLPANHVFMLHEDGEGRLWVGTSNGLALRTPDGFKVYTTADGLFSNTVFSMATAPDASMWVGSFGGVARLASLK